ncbi:lipase/acyltransferase domain-containing protein [Streptomyces sp. NBC_00158]|uniref:lipase/acyltransferase domain-containing protein n=1 Tax=Streptomyces sp. NBC_00158 TaxID=2903627 RepID=UPI0032504177
MNGRLRFDDLIVVLPGIGGSTLHRGHVPVWKPPLALGGGLRPFGRALEELAGDPRLLDEPEYDDGIVPSGLIGLPVTIPGLTKLNQYGRLRRALREHFELVPGDCAADGPPANHFEFAYDWRRDNRVSALRLKTLIDRELPKWARTLPYGRPKTVLLCHSMGGLVAKYYLDVLGGWEHCRALITFGTPFRGTLAALDLLANGVHVLGTRLNAVADVLGAFTSVHQLLPRYPVLLDRRPGTPPGQGPGHVHRSPVRLGTLDPARATDAYEQFHRRMDRHSPGPAAPLLPIVGYGHRTPQTAVFDGTRLRITTDPAALGAERRQFATGDRSVPAVSAIPVELSERSTWGWENATHSTIHATRDVLERLLRLLASGGNVLADLQSPGDPPPGTDDARGFFPLAPDPHALGLEVGDVHAAGRPVVLTCRGHGITTGPHPPTLALSPPCPPDRITLDEHGGAARWTVTGLAPGTHEVTVSFAGRAVTDFFEVW